MLGEILGIGKVQEIWEATEGDVEAFIEALYDLIESKTAEMEGNPLLAAFGIDPRGDAFAEAIQALTNAKDVDAFREVWNGLSESVKKAVLESYGDIAELVQDTEDDVTKSTDAMAENMEKLKKSMALDADIKAGRIWEDMADLLDDIAEGGSKITDVFKDVTDRVSDAATAMGALEAAANGDESAIEYLANMTGVTAEQLANNLMPAEYAVTEASNQATNSLVYLANMLYTAGAITIDANGKIVPLNNIRAAAEAAGMTLAQLSTIMAQFNGSSVTWSTTANGMQLQTNIKPIAWTGGGTSSKKSGGSGGGGGGGGGSMSVSKSVTNLLEGIEARKAPGDYRRELAQMAQSYYEATGELQGVILYLGIEKDIVEENTEKLKEYIGEIENEIEKNKAIVASNKEGSSAYKQAMMDLEKLQEDHQKYSKELAQNKVDVINLTKAIKEQYDTIRKMEIDLRNTILKAIEDRQNAEKRMLDGRINTENTILDLIKRNYERERDELLETANMKKSALQEELTQIDKLLAARKKLADEEDKLQKVAELEAKIIRISADPTRQKEAMELRKDLAELREEIAWDNAEKEAEAQKASIESQITSLDEYIEYVQKYYEDLFEHPQKLIAEMKEIISGTDEEIMDWLKKNSEEYAEATEATQQKMVEDWQTMLDDMRDTIRTYWDEVETIIAGGNENIINFLTTYSEDYRKAGKLQAEAYVDEWQKQLDDLEAAYRKVTGTIESYNYVATNTSSGSGGGGGGSGSSGGGGSGTSTTAVSTGGKVYYQYEYKDANGRWVTSTKNVNEQSAFEGAKKYAIKYWSKLTGPGVSQVLAMLNGATLGSTSPYLRKGAMLKAYSAGGVSTSTGLALLHGTTARPERILSAYQTELFEDLLDTLSYIRRVSIASYSGSPKVNTQSALPNIESINITVNSLDSNTDIEAAAEKLMNGFYRKITRTRPVGGIQGI